MTEPTDKAVDQGVGLAARVVNPDAFNAKALQRARRITEPGSW